ncbi:uncharacterized protein LY89DRAFT_675407 [Mollisia scopiformis]|uniref:ABM domain-containing protein n=1 Tax=Mollisia scopiformis TaxID=149040 RepID=A0A132BDG8_MOLSC|nr:uncharacterized protein LY89DRAFT_675407 [Mollisia scopiformis]KUJ09884.1 hypothetical protein LY89DRAFT_675407 [Mollisia scopiformis]
MSPPCTELCVFPLKPGYDIGNSNHNAADVLRDCLLTVLQQPGAQEIKFGTWVENARNLELFVDWDEKKNHDDFRATDAYGPFCQQFLSILEGNLLVIHIDFQPASKLSTVLAAPVTEVLTFYFDGAPPASYLDAVVTFAQHCLGAKGGTSTAIPGFMDLAAGITYQDLMHKGVKGKAAVVLIGWTSVDAHMKFRETQYFKDHFHLLLRDAKQFEMHHVACLDFRGHVIGQNARP